MVPHGTMIRQECCVSASRLMQTVTWHGLLFKTWDRGTNQRQKKEGSVWDNHGTGHRRFQWENHVFQMWSCSTFIGCFRLNMLNRSSLRTMIAKAHEFSQYTAVSLCKCNSQRWPKKPCVVPRIDWNSLMIKQFRRISGHFLGQTLPELQRTSLRCQAGCTMLGRGLKNTISCWGWKIEESHEKLQLRTETICGDDDDDVDDDDDGGGGGGDDSYCYRYYCHMIINIPSTSTTLAVTIVLALAITIANALPLSLFSFNNMISS